MEMLIYQAVIDPSLDSDLEVNFMGLVDKPAIERNFQAFKEHPQRAAFILNEEKRILCGPAMIPNLPLYRNDKQLGEYYVNFTADVIKTVVEKVHAKGYLKNFNLFHDEQQKTEDVVMINSFVSDKSIGVPAMLGFEDLPDGTWFISAKVNDDTIWAKVKAGEIKGFSIEGFFNYLPVAKAIMNSESVEARLTRLEKAFEQLISNAENIS